MTHSLRLLLFLRLFMRSFAFTYPLFPTVMYNFWIFEKLPEFTLIGYMVVMAIWELLMGIAGDRLPLKSLLTTYLIFALFFEFPSVFLGIACQTALHFLLWVVLWYGSLLLLALLPFMAGTAENDLIVNESKTQR